MLVLSAFWGAFESPVLHSDENHAAQDSLVLTDADQLP